MTSPAPQPENSDRPRVAPSHAHVVFCADRRYVQHVAVAAVSLARAAVRRPVLCHLLTCDADDAAVARLREALRPYPSIAVAVHRVGRPSTVTHTTSACWSGPVLIV